MSSPGRNPQERIDLCVEARRAAMQAVHARRKTLSLAQGVDVFVKVHAERGVPISPANAEQSVRLILDPWWLLKHPIQAHCEGWRIFPRD